MSLVGNLEDLGLGEILQIVSLSRKSGILTLHSRGHEGQIVLRQGQVVRASATSYQSNIGEVLLQKGVLDTQNLRKALATQETEGFRERLGTILISRFGIPADVIEGVVREQIENVVYSLFSWSDGTFDFELHENVDVSDNIRMDPLQFMLAQGINPQFLAMEGSRIIDEMRHRGEPDETAPAGAVPSPNPQTDETVDFAFDLVPAAEPPAVASPQTPLQEKKLLVMVDDDPEFCQTIQSILEDGGYEVFALGKSEEALIRVDTLYRDGKRPSVLVDLMIPRMDGSGILGGVELLDLVHRNFSDLPVLAMADYHNSGAESRIRQMGYAFMMKPRKGELGSIGTISSFSARLLKALTRVEAGEEQTEWHDKINLGDEIRLEMGEEPVPADSPAPQSTGIALLRGMLEELNDPALGGGIILLVLRFASEFMNRAVVFIVRRDVIAGLGQFGIEDKEGLAESKVRNLRIARGETSLFSRVIETQLPVKQRPDDSDWNRYLQEQLGGGTPTEVFLGPIISEGKVVAVLYGDNIPEMRPIGDTDALEIFLSQAGLAMEKALLLRRLKDKSAEET
jgi:CheY-like chemotaxis protein